MRAQARPRSRRRNERLALGDDPADAGADRQHVALGGGDEFEHARSRRVDLHRRLVGLDLEQRLPFIDMRAFGRMPAAHPAARHVHVDARHDDLDRHFSDLVTREPPRRRDDILGLRNRGFLENRAVGDRRFDPAEPHDRGVEIVEGLALGDDGRDFGPDA